MKSITLGDEALEGVEVSVLRCEACNTATYRRRLRCAACGAERLKPDTIDGVGTVFAVTEGADRTFLVVEVAEELHLLAISQAGGRWRIGERASLRSGGPLLVAEPLDRNAT